MLNLSEVRKSLSTLMKIIWKKYKLHLRQPESTDVTNLKEMSTEEIGHPATEHPGMAMLLRCT